MIPCRSSEQRPLARGLEADGVAVQLDLLVGAERLAAARASRGAVSSACARHRVAYLMWTPEIARLITRRWISEVPSKIVQILASRCMRSTGNSRE